MANYTTPTEIITKVGELLRQEVTEKNVLQVEALRFELADAKRAVGIALSEERNRFLMPKTKDTTELDRTTSLEASTAVIQRDYDFLTDIEGIIKERLKLAQVLLTTR